MARPSPSPPPTPPSASPPTYGSLALAQSSDKEQQQPAQPPQPRSLRKDMSVSGFTPNSAALTAALVVVLGLGSANSLVYRIMFAAYGERGAFFVSTGVNALYILYGGLLLGPRMLLTDKVTPRMRRLPKTRFLVMGLLDCCGTFFAAMGAVYTPGQVQTLLNQTLIPVTMLASALYLRTRFSPLQLLGAALVLGGALLSSASASHDDNDHQGTGQSRWYANLVYFLSNIPVACSQVFKEKAFKADRIDVIYLTQWVSIFQFGFGLLLAPLQAVPGVGSAHGVSMGQMAGDFGAGWRCFLEEDAGCRQRYTLALLLGYCALNIVYNTAGLYVAKHGSAALNVLTYALLLPVTTLLFSVRPLMGPYTEPLRWSTLAALAVVVLGFCLYQRPVMVQESLSRERRTRSQEKEGEEGQVLLPAAAAADTPIGMHVPSFQERVVAGLGPAIVHVSVEQDDEQQQEGGAQDGAGQRPRPPQWLDVI